MDCRIVLKYQNVVCGAVTHAILHVRGRLLPCHFTGTELYGCDSAGVRRVLFDYRSYPEFVLDTSKYNLRAEDFTPKGEQHDPDPGTAQDTTRETRVSEKKRNSPSDSTDSLEQPLSLLRISSGKSYGSVGLILAEVPDDDANHVPNFRRIGIFSFHEGLETGRDASEWMRGSIPTEE